MKYKYDIFNNNKFESHRLSLEQIKDGSKVLDLGCATGYFAKELKKKHCEVYGVDKDMTVVKKAAKYCKKIFALDLNSEEKWPFKKNSFDYVILLDVIEHLTDPEKMLRTAKMYLKDEGRMIISVPNVSHASVRWMLMNGKFEYEDTGIMDRTHIHFFTKQSFRNILGKAELKILKLIPTNGMTKVPFLRKISDRLPKEWQYKIVMTNPELFSYQFIAVTKRR